MNSIVISRPVSDEHSRLKTSIAGPGDSGFGQSSISPSPRLREARRTPRHSSQQAGDRAATHPSCRAHTQECTSGARGALALMLNPIRALSSAEVNEVY